MSYITSIVHVTLIAGSNQLRPALLGVDDRHFGVIKHALVLATKGLVAYTHGVSGYSGHLQAAKWTRLTLLLTVLAHVGRTIGAFSGGVTSLMADTALPGEDTRVRAVRLVVTARG